MATSKSERTKIVGGTIVAYRDGSHRLLRDGVLVFEGPRIVHIGKTYDGPSDRVLNAAGKIVIPGFVSTHAHVNAHEGSRPITDVGRRDVMRSAFFPYTPNNGLARAPYVAAALPDESTRFGFAQLNRHDMAKKMRFDIGPLHAARNFARLAGES